MKVLHWVAKALDVLIHIEGYPYGSLGLYQIDFDPWGLAVVTPSNTVEGVEPRHEVGCRMQHRY